MNFKKAIPMLLAILILICCVNAANAATADDNGIGLNQDGDVISLTDDGEVSQSNSDASPVLQEGNDTGDSNPSATQTPTPYEQFCEELASGQGTVCLTGDISLNDPFVLRHSVVIDGQGHSIDGQKKTNMFKVYSTSTFKNIIFKNGKAAQGGAVYCYNANLNFDNCTFINNMATENGGAIYHSTGTLTVTNCNFEKNAVSNSNAVGHGGAIWIYKGNSIISKSKFTSNTCLSKTLKEHKKATKYQFGGGAVYYNEGNTHTLTDCVFDGNQASNHGGAVYAHKSKTVKISKCTFKNNKVAFEDGGAITFNGAKLVLSDSKFSKNKAYEDGGAMDAFSLTKSKIHITITKCVFDSNVAYKGAGAIWLGVKTVFTMKNSQFTNNKASIGGALFSEDGIATITGCTFKGNKAAKITSWTVKTKAGAVVKHCGGAMMIQKKNLKITKCTFKGNKATWGGAIFFKNGKITFSGNKLTSNKAKGSSAFYSSKKIKISNKNKWGSKSTTKKALKVKNLISKNVSAK